MEEEILKLGNKHGREEELLVAAELWNANTKPFFLPFSSAATCTNCPLEVDQSLSPVIVSIWNTMS
ncbi:hypothetical protein Taro_054433 [Colocasia esculenta]|uniref:Uncharacterized protein n=1 Tax=Colocasia esculenta TaxID=4460 RepID=A0A843XNP1_COLES|nr:hypothetical protein [Colocasia esculenta]